MKAKHAIQGDVLWSGRGGGTVNLSSPECPPGTEECWTQSPGTLDRQTPGTEQHGPGELRKLRSLSLPS